MRIEQQRLMLYCEGLVWTRYGSWVEVEQVMSPSLWRRTKAGSEDAEQELERAIRALPKKLDRKKVQVKLLTVALTFDAAKHTKAYDVAPGGPRD